MQITIFPITLKESYMISPKVKHFIFHYKEKNYFNFLPGQFITIHFTKNGKQLKRSYSIANSPNKDNYIEFAASYFANGPGTDLLFNLKPGDSININGPFGRLTLKENDPKRYILVATSTGITPYRAMLHELGERLEKNQDLQLIILQGIQRREELLYEQDFTIFAQKFSKQVVFIPCFSKMEPMQLKENEHAGYVQSTFPKFCLNPQQDLVYLCGNPGMIDDSFNYLKEQGFAIQNIIREKYISR